MAKRHNMKAEKAKRNAEYALKFKKKKRQPPRRPATFMSSSPETGSAPPVSAPRMHGHDAICSRCGVETTLPFKPVSGKPVYCRSCFVGGGSQSQTTPA
jgi:CxxC-x17-CxxC domain-containing protein